ncbi:MAG: CcoQ/FixQ family Cbb3-type cytochrome c oxidase assembly chaperone [Mariprofundaceae bacterium]|nr:CcoQ/FixQ family Cbb3-type cytochrome c oxidase assembly chaperone [Mariprofundaceae bacterium]
MSEILRDFFHTDWQAMTHVDWTGLLIVLVLAALMIGLYIWIFRPSNKDKFEQYRDFVNEDINEDKEHTKREVEHGQTR